jgi:hypothetical protein
VPMPGGALVASGRVRYRGDPVPGR